MLDVDRRHFITLLSGAAVAWPLAAHAQQATMPVIGFLASGSPERSENNVAAFRWGVKQSGFVEGKDVIIDYKWARGQFDTLPKLASELVARPVNVIFAFGTPIPAHQPRCPFNCGDRVNPLGCGDGTQGRCPQGPSAELPRIADLLGLSESKAF